MKAPNRELLQRIEDLHEYIERRSREGVLELASNVILEVRRAGVLRSRTEQHNKICSAGKALLLDHSSPLTVNAFAYICVGTGTTAPTAADTALETEVARHIGATSNPTSSSWQCRYVFPAGAIASGSSTVDVTETALDHAGSVSGAILARQTNSAQSVTAADELTVAWVIA